MLPQTKQAPTSILSALAETPDLRQWANSFLLSKKAEGLTRTVAIYAASLEHFLAWCELKNVASVESLTADDLRAFLLFWGESHTPGGTHIHFRVVKTFLRWYENEVEPQNWRNPCARVKPPKLPDEPLDAVSLEDVEKLYKAAGSGRMAERDRAVILALADSGLRASELTALNLEDVDAATGTMLVRCGKGGKSRTVFIGQRARRCLRAWLRERGTQPGALFTAEGAGRLSYFGLREIVKRLAERARIPEPPLHSFRRCFAINYLRAGGDLLSLQRLLGHSDLSLLRRYCKQNVEDLRQAHAANSPLDRAGL